MQEISPPNVDLSYVFSNHYFLRNKVHTYQISSRNSWTIKSRVVMLKKLRQPDEDEDEEFVQLVKIEPEDLKSFRRT